jgi:hypothetical protein
VKRAFFGPPIDDDQPGGMHIGVYVVPVIEGDLVAFDIDDNPAINGRWLPWAILPWRGNPYETASTLADTWCDVEVQRLQIVDVLSFVVNDVWEMAIIFRAELGAAPRAIAGREVVRIAPDTIDQIQAFEPTELRRWVEQAPATIEQGPAPTAKDGSGLVF